MLIENGIAEARAARVSSTQYRGNRG